MKTEGFENIHGKTIIATKRKNKIIKEITKELESDNFSKLDVSLLVKRIGEKQGIPASTTFRIIKEILYDGLKDKYNYDDPLIETSNEGIYKLLSHMVDENLDSRNRLFPHFALHELFEDNLSNPLFPNDSEPTKLVSSFMEEEKILFDRALNYKDNLTRETRFLVDFSLKIGLYVTFVMLKTIKPQSGEKNREEKNAESLSWLTNSILSDKFLFYFMKQDVIRKNLKIYQSRIKSRVGSDKKIKDITSTKDRDITSIQSEKKDEKQESISNYEINENAYQNLEQGFKTILPFTYILLDYLQRPEYLDNELKELIKSTKREQYKHK
ncbi:hypothetical protein [Candidatus Nitrosocosmicus sp. FF01]|uniref:hypothetical protein n=1 Tax=Candidatus Nitrosocosmicus sp. FF01 TaxID=3397670 RepID=UPI0039EAC896